MRIMSNMISNENTYFVTEHCCTFLWSQYLTENGQMTSPTFHHPYTEVVRRPRVLPWGYRGYPAKRAYAWQVGSFWQDTLDTCTRPIDIERNLCFRLSSIAFQQCYCVMCLAVIIMGNWEHSLNGLAISEQTRNTINTLFLRQNVVLTHLLHAYYAYVFAGVQPILSRSERRLWLWIELRFYGVHCIVRKTIFLSFIEHLKYIHRI